LEKSGEVKINEIIKKTVDTIDKSRGAIFDIAESARKEVNHLKSELIRLQSEVETIINEEEELERMLLRSKTQLAEINKNFSKHTQDDMRIAYEEADKARVKLAVIKERGKNVIHERNESERRLRDAIGTVSKADALVTQVGTAMEYLSGNLSKIGDNLDASESNKLLALRIIRAHEDERNRISREIHDGPAQAMSNVVLKSEIIEKLFDIDINRTKNEIKNLKTITKSCLVDVRRIIYDLRPMSLDDLGLRPTLLKYMTDFQEENSVKTELIVRGEESLLKDKNMILSIFRIIQECLNNIKKHANASAVNIQLEMTRQNILIRVKDDGKGFDLEKYNTVRPGTGNSFGLYGMRERVELLRGTFELESAPGKGTTIRVALPYQVEGS
jgi:two-component system sensor histidine kinase DegS